LKQSETKRHRHDTQALPQRGTMTALFNHFQKGNPVMKTWIKRSLFALLGTSVLLGGLAACGHRDHEFGASMSPEKYTQKRDKMVDKVAGRLDLNADQKKRLQTLGDTLYAQRTALIGQTKDPRAEMKALVAGDKFDAVRAQALITDKTTVLQSKSPEVIAAMAEFYNSLNPAQQQKLRDVMDGRSRWSWRG
jgi:Spy/CpxP family protein refolding chaperone